MRRIRGALRGLYSRIIRPSLCADCKTTIDRKLGLKGRIKHRMKHRKSSRHKLRAGVHRKMIKGKMRKFRVLRNGQWRFMKG